MTSQLVQLCGATVPCPDTGKEMGCIDGIRQGYRPFQNKPHELCHGTGRVYLLSDSVRKPCSEIHTSISTQTHTEISSFSIRNASCKEVGCCGWVPTGDAWVLIKEAGSLIIRPDVGPRESQELEGVVWGGEKPFVAAFLSLVQSIPGVQLGK